MINKLLYNEAIQMLGQEYEYDNKFKRLAKEENELYVIQNDNDKKPVYFFLEKDISYDGKQIQFPSLSNVTISCLSEIVDYFKNNKSCDIYIRITICEENKELIEFLKTISQFKENVYKDVEERIEDKVNIIRLEQSVFYI